MEEVGIRAECEAEGAKAFIAAQTQERTEVPGTYSTELSRKMNSSLSDK